MVINVKSLTDLSGFYVVYNTTIKNEKIGSRGISHFIEHLICKNFEHLLEDFEKNGINWNAYTSDTNIVFYITGLDEYLKNFKNDFLNCLINFKISNIEIEKKIILEEYTDSFNKQHNAHFLNLYRKLFNNYNPIGEYNDIIDFSEELSLEYFNNYYCTPSSIINVSKKYPFYTDIKFNNLNNDYKVDYIKDNDFIYQKTNIYKSKISIIYLSNIINDDYPYISFITSILSNGLKSPFYNELREKNGLVYYINCYLDNLTNISSVINISTETSETNLNKLNDLITEIFNNKEKYITLDRFDIVKKSYEIHYKKNEINKYININKYLSPKYWLIEPILKNLTLDKIYDIYDKYFILDNFYISYDKHEFLKNDKNDEKI